MASSAHQKRFGDFEDPRPDVDWMICHIPVVKNQLLRASYDCFPIQAGAVNRCCSLELVMHQWAMEPSLSRARGNLCRTI